MKDRSRDLQPAQQMNKVKEDRANGQPATPGHAALKSKNLYKHGRTVGRIRGNDNHTSLAVPF
jgi:hypothetical protein